MDVEVPMTPEVLKDEIRLIRSILYQHVQRLTYAISDLAIDYEIEDEDIKDIMQTLAWMAGHISEEAIYPSEKFML
jgi:glutathionyl-hydroquinone reductase